MTNYKDTSWGHSFIFNSVVTCQLRLLTRIHRQLATVLYSTVLYRSANREETVSKLLIIVTVQYMVASLVEGLLPLNQTDAYAG